MTRTLTAGMQTEIAASLGETIRLIELQFAGGTVRYSTGTVNVVWNAVTWTAIGGAFEISATPESGDIASSSAEITLAAVESTLAQTIAAEKFVGRIVKLYVAHIDLTTRAVVVDPLLVYSGIMSGGWTITETRTKDGGGTITATVKCVSRLVALTEHRGIQANLVSHWAHYPGDNFFAQSAQQLTQPVAWGKSYQKLGGGGIR